MDTDDKIAQLIREIASKHGIAVARDDPILVLQTINQRLLQDSVKAQEALLDHFKEELEGIATRWGNDAREKAERILNAALAASRDSVEVMAQRAATSSAGAISQQLASLLGTVDTASARAHRAALLNLVASCVTAGACVMVLLVR
ncbi:conjugal transfer protein TraM [Oxalobacteraceae bacterium A2-2]